MKKNVMKEIAKQFGLKLREQFFIEDKGKFLLDDDFGLMKKTGDNVGDVTVVRDDTLRQLLTGQYEVIRLSTPILSNSENEYLSNIINPIRNKVVAIRKLESFNFNYIQIADDFDLGYGEIPSKHLKVINDTAKKGVTIWHNHSSIGDYTVNNINI